MPSGTNCEKKKSQQIPYVGEECETGSEGPLGPRKVDAPSKAGIKSTRKDWMPINLNRKSQGGLPRSQLPRRSNTTILHLPSHLEKGWGKQRRPFASLPQGELACTRRLTNVAGATQQTPVSAWCGTWDPAIHLSPPPRRGCSLFSVPLHAY